MKSPTPWTTAGAANAREGSATAVASAARSARVTRASGPATTGADSAGVWKTCPPFVPQHSLPIALQAARSVPLRQSDRAAAAARLTAAVDEHQRCVDVHWHPVC